jgi:hypothetical protein
MVCFRNECIIKRHCDFLATNLTEIEDLDYELRKMVCFRNECIIKRHLKIFNNEKGAQIRNDDDDDDYEKGAA